MSHTWIPNDALLERPLLDKGSSATCNAGHDQKHCKAVASHLDLEAVIPGLKASDSSSLGHRPATNQVTLCLCISRAVSLLFLLSASVVLVSIDFTDFPLPRSWAFSVGIGLAFASFSLVWIVALLIISFGRRSSISTNLILSSLVYDLACSILLFGAAIAVVPDSSGGSRAFEAEKRFIASSMRRHHGTRLIDDPEFWDVQDSFKRVHRSASAVCYFLTSLTSVLSLAYVSTTQLQLKLSPTPSQP